MYNPKSVHLLPRYPQDRNARLTVTALPAVLKRSVLVSAHVLQRGASHDRVPSPLAVQRAIV
jgi:hypothetical protein